MFKMSVSPQDAPDAIEKIRIEFKAGVPVSIENLTSKKEGKKTNPLDIFLYANEVAGRNGIGRIDIVENRFVGIKSRGVYETPGGTLLREAHLDIEGITLDREVKRLTEQLGLEFSKFCYQGFWFAPEMNLVRHSMDFAQKDVDGLVEMELYKGNITITGRSSDKTLYSADLASMDIEDAGEGFDYNPKDSQGFIRINAVRLKMFSNREEKLAKK